MLKVCCIGNNSCALNETAWVPTPASQIEGSPLTIALTVPNTCASKTINAIRYLWRTTPCLFKEAAVYNSVDSDLPAHLMFISFNRKLNLFNLISFLIN